VVAVIIAMIRNLLELTTLCLNYTEHVVYISSRKERNWLLILITIPAEKVNE